MANLRDELLAIREEFGRLTPKVVVEAATPSTHPLHAQFEWDDTVAGQRWREEQAAWLIRHVRISYQPKDETKSAVSVRAFHSVDTPEHGPVYNPIEEVLDDPIARQILLRDMQRDWIMMKDRYDSFIEFWELVRTDLEEAV